MGRRIGHNNEFQCNTHFEHKSRSTQKIRKRPSKIVFEVEENMEVNQTSDREKLLQDARKVLRTVKSCSSLDWDNPSAHEVYDRLYVGNRVAATNTEFLKKIGITHLLNTAHPGDHADRGYGFGWIIDRLKLTFSGPTYSLYNNPANPCPEAAMSVHVDEAELRSAGIQYLGLQLDDVEQQKIGPTFQQSGDWVNQALRADNSKVLINCWAGISRSSTTAIAFLMNHRNMHLIEALKQVKSARNIQPNGGFLNELVDLELSRLQK